MLYKTVLPRKFDDIENFNILSDAMQAETAIYAIVRTKRIA
jgi:hypothetical protein